MILQRSANLERTPSWLFRAMEEYKCHPISSRYADEFTSCFRSAETFGTPHELLQLLQQFDLLVHE